MNSAGELDSSREHWHLKKEITWGHILTTASLVAAGFGAWATMNARIDANTHKNDLTKVEVTYIKELQQTKIDELDKALKNFQTQFERVERKLDQLIDRKLQHGMGGAMGNGTYQFRSLPVLPEQGTLPAVRTAKED